MIRITIWKKQSQNSHLKYKNNKNYENKNENNRIRVNPFGNPFIA